MIRKIAGKNQSSTIKHLIKSNDEITNIKDIADTLAETFSANSSSDNTNTEFHNNKGKTKKQKLNINSDNTENYNGFFTFQELKEAKQTSYNTTVGPDEIHYEFLKQLPPKSLDYLINRFNYDWKKIHHHHMVARISLSRHSSLSFIALGRSSGQHPVSSHSC